MQDTCLKEDICPMMLAHKLLSGKRKIMILWLLSNKTLRFSEIQKKLPDITRKMLTKQLRDLEEDKLILRHIYPAVPPKVEYEITDVGRRIVPVMEQMHMFGASYIDTFRREVMEKYAGQTDHDLTEVCTPDAVNA